MSKWLDRIFKLQSHGTTVRTEILAGFVGFFTVAYILAVNSLILSEAGMPLGGAVLATALASFIGCVLMGAWANAPVLLVPGMGINALFTYTLVQSMGLTWQSALAVVFASGVIFAAVAFSKLSAVLNRSIPKTLKDAISVGLGMFLILIGLEKAQLVVRGSSSLMELGDLTDPRALAGIATFLIAIVLFIWNVPGNFLWSMILGTILAALFGILPAGDGAGMNLRDFGQVFGAMDFGSLVTVPFIVAIFSLTMVVLFENIGLSHSHAAMLGKPEKYGKILQATGVSAMLSGLFGTSPTVATVETASSISAGGRTGLTSIISGVLFLGSIFFIPYIRLIPDSAIAPILLIIGGLMVQNIRHIDLSDVTEAFPAIFIIALIPFTGSIADGIAAGFIMFPVMKVFTGNARQVSGPMYAASALFLLYFIVQHMF